MIMMGANKNFKILIGLFLAAFAIFFLPFWKTLAVSGIFAFVIYPYLKKTPKQKYISTKWVIAAVSLTTLIILAPFVFGIYSLSSQVIEYSKDATTNVLQPDNLKKMISQKVVVVSKGMGIPMNKSSDMIAEKISSSLGTSVLSLSTAFISSLPDLGVEVVIFTLGLYLFLSYGVYIKGSILNHRWLKKKDLDELIDVLHRSCEQCLLSLMLVGALQSTVVVIGAAIAGYSMLMTIFIITFFLSFIPVIGAAPVAFALAFFKFMEADWSVGFFMVAVGIVAGTVDNVAKPLLIGRGIDMDGAVALISIIGAIVVLGLPGLFIGPVVGTTAIYYFHKLQHEPQTGEVAEKK